MIQYLPMSSYWHYWKTKSGKILVLYRLHNRKRRDNRLWYKNHPSIWAEKGVYNWVLANPILYENPIEDVKGKLSFWDYPSIKEVKIECPECGSIEIAVEDIQRHHSQLICIGVCEHVIIESEWKEVKL